MFDIVLYQPEIPPNTGNIMRLCANTGCALHLIEPLGFSLEEKQLRRAGLDYREFAEVQLHPDLAGYITARKPAQILAFSTRGNMSYSEVSYAADAALVFGPETRGLPTDWLQSGIPEAVLRLPMRQQSRSLNLSNAVAVVVYEAWRQQGFAGGR